MFKQPVLEQRRVRDSEDGELKHKHRKLLLQEGAETSPPGFQTSPETGSEDHRRAAASDPRPFRSTSADGRRSRCIVEMVSD